MSFFSSNRFPIHEILEKQKKFLVNYFLLFLSLLHPRLSMFYYSKYFKTIKRVNINQSQSMYLSDELEKGEVLNLPGKEFLHLLCVYSARKTEMWHHLQDCFFFISRWASPIFGYITIPTQFSSSVLNFNLKNIVSIREVVFLISKHF